MSSRLVYNLFSKELWAPSCQSFLEVSSIADIVLPFFFTSAWLITAICYVKIQRATMTAVHGMLWDAVSNLQNSIWCLAITQPGSGRHLPGYWRRQCRFGVSFLLSFYFVMIVYTVPENRVGCAVQLAPSCVCQYVHLVLWFIQGTEWESDQACVLQLYCRPPRT